jgi:ParB family chromosome partitioning protein
MQAFRTNVGFDELDLEDDRFAIHSFSPHHRLMGSLDQFGIFSPLWLWGREDRKCITVDGFKRLAWARKTGRELLPCIVFSESCSYEQLLLLRVEGKLFGPPLNAAEKAQIISKLAQAIPREYISDHILPPLGIPRRDEAIASWCRLSQAGKAFLKVVASGEIFERAAFELSTWEEEERGEVVGMLEDLRCSASIQMEIIERVKEIALREDRQRLAVLRQPELQAIVQMQHTNHRQKTEALRALLTRWRFPRLSAREERFVREWNAASLPKAIRLSPPLAFEGECWQLQITFTSPQELQRLLEQAGKFADSSLLESIISSSVAQ